MAISRRKACLECVGAKRRCGQQFPQCQRCQNRGLDCQYSARQSARLAAASIPSPTTPIDLEWHDSIYTYASSPSLSWGFKFDIGDLLAMAPPLHIESAEPEMTQMSRQEMEFCVSQFVEYPSLWLKSGSAPFIHPSVYSDGIPNPLKAAYSAAAVYATVSPQNSSMAWTTVENLAESVLEDQLNGPWTTLELLAHVQALCIIQIIRLFGPDVRQRYLAEITEPTLVSWTENLSNQTATERTISAGSANSWRSWLLCESIRRTIIMSFMIRGVYSLVKYGYCNIAPSVTALSFTAQRRLWNATTAQEWRQACAERNEHWVGRMQFANLFAEAAKPDIEELGVLMSVTYCGQGSVEEWLNR
jgi:hypothetical protein